MDKYDWDLHDSVISVLDNVDDVLRQLRREKKINPNLLKTGALKGAFNARSSAGARMTFDLAWADLVSDISERVEEHAVQSTALASRILEHLRDAVEVFPLETDRADLKRDRAVRIQQLQNLFIQNFHALPVHHGNAAFLNEQKEKMIRFMEMGMQVALDPQGYWASRDKSHGAAGSAKLAHGYHQQALCGLSLATHQAELAEKAMVAVLSVMAANEKPAPDTLKLAVSYRSVAMAITRAARFNLECARMQLSLHAVMDDIKRPVFMHVLPPGGDVRSAPPGTGPATRLLPNK